jgi:uncharacterized protein (TIGR02145 family)
MKITIKLLFLLLIIISGLSAQTPHSFKYQAIVRDTSGSIVPNQPVSLKISLLTGTETGPVVYSEIHSDSTNQYGLLTLDVGKGVAETGNLSSINWAADKYFLRLEIDITGSTNYVFMGTSQLLSVPYSLHSITSERILTFTDEQRDTMSNVLIGTSFFNLTSRKINYYEGSHWYEVNSTCLPQPTMPNAGPDQLNISGVVAMLNANVPVSGTGHWKIKTGTGGHIADTLNPLTQFSGLSGTTYTVSWIISNSCTSLSDDIILSFAPFSCGLTFKDSLDNKVYKTILIGTVCWMAENLNTGTRITGDDNMLNNNIIEKYCIGNLESHCDVYGGLYQWNEMMQYTTTPGTQGICPSDWHLPTDEEWKILEGTVDSQYGIGDPVWDLEGDRGFDAGGILKEAGTVHWSYPNTGATNSSGFTALPGGARNTDGTYPSFLVSGRFWSSTEESGSNAFRHILSTTRMDVARNAATKNFGISVRCIRN